MPGWRMPTLLQEKGHTLAGALFYDRKNRSILGNEVLYDLVVTPAAVKKIDTAYLCNILQIDRLNSNYV